MEPVRGTLQKIMAQTIRRLPPQEAVATAWPFVCGNVVAERTEVLNFSDGILLITVPDATWRSQLFGMSAQYIAALCGYTGQELKKIEFLLPAQAEKWRASRDTSSSQNG